MKSDNDATTHDATTYADLKEKWKAAPKVIAYDAATKRRRSREVLGLEPDAAAQEDCINANRLFGTRTRQLLNLAQVVALCSQPAGDAGEDGVVNPANALNQLLASGVLDTMPAEDFERLLAAVDDLSVLWEGKRAAQSFTLACNALLRTVLEDEELFFAAYAKTRGRLIVQGQTVTGTHGQQYEREGKQP